MSQKKVTLQVFLQQLFERAYEYKDGVRGKVKNRQLANFLNENDLIGVTNGSPHWRRNENFYNRGKK